MKVKSLTWMPMFRSATACFVAFALSIGGGAVIEPVFGEDAPAAAKPGEGNLPRTVDEARGRARWVHEIIHGALQVMHRDFFDEDAVERSLPSQSLDDVFSEMARTYAVDIRWLGGNATKGKDHFPKDAFEEAAVAALIAGKPEYEAVENGRYRFAGTIRMQNQCLKCHVRDRKSLEDRVAGLAISFPLAPE